jgi:hypothetical protein
MAFNSEPPCLHPQAAFQFERPGCHACTATDTSRGGPAPANPLGSAVSVVDHMHAYAPPSSLFVCHGHRSIECDLAGYGCNLPFGLLPRPAGGPRSNLGREINMVAVNILGKHAVRESTVLSTLLSGSFHLVFTGGH